MSPLFDKIGQYPELSAWLGAKHWENNFYKQSLQRGRSYAHEGAIRKIDLSLEADGGVYIEAEVVGNELYETEIELSPDTAENHFFDIEYTTCSCPVGENCKHAAALLYFLLKGIAKKSSSFASKGQLDLDLNLPATQPKSKPNQQLDRDTLLWLESLGANHRYATIPKKKSPTPTKVLTYCIEPELSHTQSETFCLYLRPADVRKSGEVSIKDSQSKVSPGQLPGYITDEHQSSALRYWSLNQQNWRDPIIFGPEYSKIILHALETKSLYHLTESPSTAYQKLSEGPPLSAELSWQQNPDGSSQPAIALSDSEAFFLATDPPLYLKPSTNEIGSVSSDVPFEIFVAWKRGPVIQPEEASLLATQLATTLERPNFALPTPQSLEQKTISPDTLTPIFYLTSAPLSRWSEEETLIGQLLYQYEDSPRLSPLSSRQTTTASWTVREELKVVTRSRSQERKYEEVLQRLALVRVCDAMRTQSLSPEINRAFLMEENEEDPSEPDAIAWLFWLEEFRKKL